MLRTPFVNELYQGTGQAGRSAQDTAYWAWPITTALLRVGEALREGIAAHHQYESLRSRGIAHDKALRQAVGVFHSNN
jgi:hypothetical protein